LLSGYEASAFFGIGAPKTTPIAVINKLSEAVNVSLVDSKMIRRLAELVRPCPAANSVWKADHSRNR